jgi:hypothetical protein
VVRAKRREIAVQVFVIGPRCQGSIALLKMRQEWRTASKTFGGEKTRVVRRGCVKSLVDNFTATGVVWVEYGEGYGFFSKDQGQGWGWGLDWGRECVGGEADRWKPMPRVACLVNWLLAFSVPKFCSMPVLWCDADGDARSHRRKGGCPLILWL